MGESSSARLSRCFSNFTNDGRIEEQATAVSDDNTTVALLTVSRRLHILAQVTFSSNEYNK